MIQKVATMRLEHLLRHHEKELVNFLDVSMLVAHRGVRNKIVLLACLRAC